MPGTWIYPFLGRFEPIDQERWFPGKLLLELQNPVEWVSALLLAGYAVYRFHQQITSEVLSIGLK
ncbi:hypothetical protein [Methanosphaerula palustris]|uniref:hypothetical protein n=1 Tax=Methanosphaerula palustris TaxID=475088 RepID=UPI000184931B|nr:hypothetical protein [Methanosphaerula palustris]